MWLILALLSAVFAALTSILAKVGIEGVDSNLGTAIRTLVVFFMAMGMVYLTGAKVSLAEISTKTWVFLVLSGLATGASWLCYFKALQIGDVSKVAPIDKTSIIFTIIMAVIFLHEQLTLKVAVGGALIAAGTLVMAF
ncbi:EamA family transporter [uncultured Mailhella sp.]|uniref:EamA family transporter n=1 Tax=uncultured Mailhella sp. TaxID=1981031 RepID=UPI0025D314FA|nr:EamA family transporter [uncultured Mailhella sp.]